MSWFSVVVLVVYRHVSYDEALWFVIKYHFGRDIKHSSSRWESSQWIQLNRFSRYLHAK